MDSQSSWDDLQKANSSESDLGFKIEEYFGNSLSCEINVEEDEFPMGSSSQIRSRVQEQLPFENNLQIMRNSNEDQMVRATRDLSTGLRTIPPRDGQHQNLNPNPGSGSSSSQSRYSSENSLGGVKLIL